LNISVQAVNLSDCRIESNRNFFSPNWNALLRAGTCAKPLHAALRPMLAVALLLLLLLLMQACV